MKPDRELYKQAAITIAKKICRCAIWHSDTCNWAGLATEDNSPGRTAYTRALPPDFYDGIAGVAFFLLQVYRIHPHPVILKTLQGALQQLMADDPESYRENENNFLNGFYQGRGGIIFVLKMAAKILDDEKPDKEGEKRLSDILIASEADEQTDIISGIGGIILFLLYLYGLDNKRDDLLNHAVKLGKILLAKAEKNENGYSWQTIDTALRNLTGYAHGASGIATAFVELYAITKGNNFLFAAKEAFRYENSFFNQEKQNWPDFRFNNISNKPEEEVCSLAWCHGAPGIGLARFRAYEITGDTSFLDEALKAVLVTRKYFAEDMLHDYTLCHGLFGNASLLLKAASVLKDENIEKEVTDLADNCLQQFIYRNIPVPNGYHSSKESPCFMQGNSGIGYFFLQLYDPHLFPSWLQIGTGMQAGDYQTA
jgi:lantibiotic biosynthesis protein